MNPNRLTLNPKTRSQTPTPNPCTEIADHAAVLGQRYRALWDLERVLYQRFRYSDGGVTGAADESLVNQLHEQVWGLGFGV